MLNVLCDHRPLTRLNFTPLLSLAGMTTTPFFLAVPPPYFRVEDVLSNSRLIAGSSERGAGNQGWETWGATAGTRFGKAITLDLPADNKLATLPTRCFIAPRRELEILRGGGCLCRLLWMLNYLIDVYIHRLSGSKNIDIVRGVISFLQTFWYRSIRLYSIYSFLEIIWLSYLQLFILF